MDKPNDPWHEPSQAPRGYRPFLLLVLFFSLYLAYLVLLPFLNTLILSVVLASLFYPVQVRLVQLYGGRKNLAALTVVFIITFAIVIPILFFLSALINQGLETIARIDDWVREGNLQRLSEHARLLGWVEWFRDHIEVMGVERLDFQSHFLGLSKNFGQLLLTKGAAFLGDVANLVSRFFIMIFVIFYLVRDGRKMIDNIKYLSPLQEYQEDRILNGIRVVARSVFLGSFLTAVCQGLVGGIGLAIVGIPGIFWGTIMGFSSLIPVIGTALVWVPAVIYLMLLGKWTSAIFLTIWSLFLVGTIDNFLRPFLMRGEAQMSPFYIFLAILGGVQYFGLVGILYGPLIISFAMVMLYIYSVEYHSLLTGRGRSDKPVSQ